MQKDSPDRPAALRCEQITKKFDGVEALKGVTIRILSGTITALIGPNGAGKTTLLNVLTGFDRSDTGQWFLDGRELTGLPAYRIARLGVVRTFQDLRIMRRVSALDNVLLALSRTGEDGLVRSVMGRRSARHRECIESARLALDRFGLKEAEEIQAGTMSYGQQKLLSLACVYAHAVAGHARALLLDEPMAGVHPSLIRRVQEAMEDLRARGYTIAFIEHDIRAVRAVADHVIAMDNGEVKDSGAPDEVLHRRGLLEAYLD